jgi:hypothetical protein
MDGGNGGAGGGAICIAAAGSISLNGLINANGGNHIGFFSGGGSGGAVRLVSKSVTGNGRIQAVNNTNLANNYGRIRIESDLLSSAIVTIPETIGVPPADPPILWPAANAPKARIVSVDAVAAPEDPTSPVVAAADLAIQNNEPVNILIETKDFPIEGVVQLAVIPKFGGRSWMTATRVSGDITKATWRVITSLPQGFVTLQARATQP